MDIELLDGAVKGTPGLKKSTVALRDGSKSDAKGRMKEIAECYARFKYWMAELSREALGDGPREKWTIGVCADGEW